MPKENQPAKPAMPDRATMEAKIATQKAEMEARIKDSKEKSLDMQIKAQTTMRDNMQKRVDEMTARIKKLQDDLAALG